MIGHCVVFQHSAGAVAVTIDHNDTAVVSSDVTFDYQNEITPRLTSQNATTATPQGDI